MQHCARSNQTSVHAVCLQYALVISESLRNLFHLYTKMVLLLPRMIHPVDGDGKFIYEAMSSQLSSLGGTEPEFWLLCWFDCVFWPIDGEDNNLLRGKLYGILMAECLIGISWKFERSPIRIFYFFSNATK